MDYLDNMEEEYHKSYPDDPCPMDGGYKASFERFVIEFLREQSEIYHLRPNRSKKSVLICESLRKYSRNRLAFSKESRIFADVKI